jgi:uncharacterized integral membrane protein
LKWLQIIIIIIIIIINQLSVAQNLLHVSSSWPINS